jgi:hypothetical protein
MQTAMLVAFIWAVSLHGLCIWIFSHVLPDREIQI